LKSNNWTGGRVEVSMMRQYHRDSGLDSKMQNILHETIPESLEHKFIATLVDINKSTQTKGTLQDSALSSARVAIGTVASSSEDAADLIRLGLFRYYNQDRPQVHYAGDKGTAGTRILESFIETFNFAFLDGRKIIPTTRSARNSAGSSIVQVRIGDKRHAGEIRSLFVHQQSGVVGSSNTVLAAISWMIESDWTPLKRYNGKFIWDDFPELGIETWVLDKFQDPLRSELPIIIPLEQVHCQLSRGRILHTTPPMWMTATMDR
ncbi:hypothetical protein R3P38DRAFT_2378737, partial [Favolaschia claudopus]